MNAIQAIRQLFAPGNLRDRDRRDDRRRQQGRSVLDHPSAGFGLDLERSAWR